MARLNLIENSEIQKAIIDPITQETKYVTVIVNLAIRQGKTYSFSFSYPQDLTEGEMRGQIRNNWAQDGGELLGEFDFDITYDGEKSLVIVNLDAVTTANIPYTRYQGNGVLSTRTAWVYDIEYEENLTVIPMFDGFNQVRPEVTI